MTAGTILGLALALASTTCYNWGLIVEKHALAQLPAITGRRITATLISLATSVRWLSGFALMLTGLGLQVVALALAPVTLVQPLVAGGVAVTLVMSRLILHEQLNRAQYWCVAVMAVSVVLLAASASHASAEVGHQVNGLLLAAVAVPSALIGLLTGASAIKAAVRKHRYPATGISYGVATGLLYGVAALAIKGLSGALVHQHGPVALLVALLSSPYLYVMGAASAAGMLLFQTALQRCRISILAPVTNVLGSVYFIVAGTWIFRESLPSSPVQLVLRIGGIAITCCVVVQLSRQQAPGSGRPAVSRMRPARPAAVSPVRVGPRSWPSEGES